MPLIDANQIIDKYGMENQGGGLGVGNRFRQERLRRQALAQQGGGLANQIQGVQNQMGTMPIGSMQMQSAREGYVERFGGMPNARQGLIGPTMGTPGMPGRPIGVPGGMGMTPPSMGVFNPALQGIAKSNIGMPFSRESADGIMKRYGMMG